MVIKNPQGEPCGLFSIGGPGGIRTPDLLVRSQTLYPAELRSHIIAVFNRRKILRIGGNQFIMASVPFPFKDGSRPFRAVNVTEHTGLHLVFVNQLFENRVLFCRIKRRIMQSQQDFIVPFFFGSVQRSSDPQRFMTENTV